LLCVLMVHCRELAIQALQYTDEADRSCSSNKGG
jgi:hypothetical protein